MAPLFCQIMGSSNPIKILILVKETNQAWSNCESETKHSLTRWYISSAFLEKSSLTTCYLAYIYIW